MKTSEQIEKEFRERLQALLDEFGADIDVEDVGRDFYGKYEMFVHIPPVFHDGAVATDSTVFSLGFFVESRK